MLEVVDLFCGAGGMTLGLAQAGLRPRIGVDVSPDCIRTYQRNFPKAAALHLDIAELDPSDILSRLTQPKRFVLAGCPPCQLFSKLQRNRKTDDRVIRRYLELIEALAPEYLVFENVPQIRNFPRVWGRLTGELSSLGYHFEARRFAIASLGVAQHRERLVLLAAKSPLSFPNPRPAAIRTVRDVISHLPDTGPGIPNHRSMRPLRRISDAFAESRLMVDLVAQ